MQLGYKYLIDNDGTYSFVAIDGIWYSYLRTYNDN